MKRRHRLVLGDGGEQKGLTPFKVEDKHEECDQNLVKVTLKFMSGARTAYIIVPSSIATKYFAKGNHEYQIIWKNGLPDQIRIPGYSEARGNIQITY